VDWGGDEEGRVYVGWFGNGVNWFRSFSVILIDVLFYIDVEHLIPSS
jgi:hypothetical protein